MAELPDDAGPTAGIPLSEPQPVDIQPEPEAPAPIEQRYYRHARPVRIGHWINVVCLFILVMSGLQIFNAHPALYWGDRSDRDRPLLAMRAVKTDSGEPKGVTTLLGASVTTTGLFGYSGDRARGFPSWATIPSGKWLAMGRQWHLFFAWLFVINGLIFWTYSLISRHLSRDLFPWWNDLKQIGRTLLEHLTFTHPEGEAARHYNVLQKLAYTGVVFVLGPLIVLTGLTMSPNMDAAFPFLLDVFGGRQSARTIHFLACFAFVGFVLVHVTMVATTGLWNNLRSMLTGWFAVKQQEGRVDEQIH